jgi:hypothetical protein
MPAAVYIYDSEKFILTCLPFATKIPHHWFLCNG